MYNVQCIVIIVHVYMLCIVLCATVKLRKYTGIYTCTCIYIYVNCAKKIEVDINLYTMYMYNIFKNNSWGFEYIVILPRVGP